MPSPGSLAQKPLAKKPGKGDKVLSIAGDPSANIGPQDDSCDRVTASNEARQCLNKMTVTKRLRQ